LISDRIVIDEDPLYMSFDKEYKEKYDALVHDLNEKKLKSKQSSPQKSILLKRNRSPDKGSPEKKNLSFA
jgi:hypothetical protein